MGSLDLLFESINLQQKCQTIIEKLTVVASSTSIGNWFPFRVLSMIFMVQNLVNEKVFIDIGIRYI
jgi:hypothetical protein